MLALTRTMYRGYFQLFVWVVLFACAASTAAAQSVASTSEPAAAAAVPAPSQVQAGPAATATEQPASKPPSVSEKEPPTGLGGLILGYGGIGLGALNLALIPACSADFYPSNAEDLCVTLSIAYGVIGIGAGIPLAIMGHVRRSRYLKWKAEHARSARFLPELGVVPDPSTPGLTARFRF